MATMIFSIVLGMYALADSDLQNMESHLHQHFVTRNYVFDILKSKNQKLNELKARENELLKATAE